jgi:S-adenosylmethionine:tRNA ribosyltransferase-isomerase
MKTNDFDFYLPEHLIAQNPPEKRGQSRLMLLDRICKKCIHESVINLPQILCSESFLSPLGEKPLLVFNDTKVRKARLLGESCETGAQVEFLLLEKTGSTQWKALVHRSSRRKTGSRYVFHDSAGEIARAEIIGEQGKYRIVQFENPIDDDFLEKYGHVPLPPYIKRKDAPADAERYQTVYAKETGSAAAPTAGLHFTNEILDNLKLNGIEKAFVTLHVGLGTFLPVRSENIEEHEMHEEQFIITDENAAIIEKAITGKRKIIAVGTTSLRSLESAVCDNSIKRGWQTTSIFIYPGYKFKAVDALFTNFHTPLSTLLMLVSAFAGREFILESYAEAVKESYRFFSYGDAMLIY